jgi:uncharacterized membrane protein (DUF106 family)
MVFFLYAMHPALSIFLVSLVLTVVTTIAYKYLTDQARIKKLKADMKKDQERIKKLAKEDPDKAMKIQKAMLEKNMELMKHSFKPTLYTLIPLLLVFGWLGGHLAYEPLHPDEPFTVTLAFAKGTTGNVTLSSLPNLEVAADDKATKPIVEGLAAWTLRGPAGEYQLTFKHANGVAITKDIIITDEKGVYRKPIEPVREKPFKMVTIGNEKIKPLAGVPLVGNWGWIGVYIIFSLALSFGLRKLMDVA